MHHETQGQPSIEMFIAQTVLIVLLNRLRSATRHRRRNLLRTECLQGRFYSFMSYMSKVLCLFHTKYFVFFVQSIMSIMSKVAFIDLPG